MQQQPPTAGTYKTQYSRIIALLILGALLGVLIAVLRDQTEHMLWYALGIGIPLGLIGFKWKVFVPAPQSLVGLSKKEIIAWFFGTLIVTPLLTGTIAYYMYAYKNKYPTKWRHFNFVLIPFAILYLGLILSVVLG